MKLCAISALSGLPVDIEFDENITRVRESVFEESRRVKDAGLWVSPGFIDIQVNGFLGSDYSLPDLESRHIKEICAKRSIPRRSIKTSGAIKSHYDCTSSRR